MTLDLENEYKVLALFLAEDKMTMSRLSSLANKEVGYLEANKIISNFDNKGYLYPHDEDIVSDPSKPQHIDAMLFHRKYPLSSIGMDYFSHLVEIKKQEAFQQQQMVSSLLVNDSIQKLNKATEGFYEHQKEINGIQRSLTAALFFTAAVSAIIATCEYIQPKDSDKYIQLNIESHKKQLQQLTDSISFQNDKIRQLENVLDSLK